MHYFNIHFFSRYRFMKSFHWDENLELINSKETLMTLYIVHFTLMIQNIKTEETGFTVVADFCISDRLQ